MSPEQCRGVNVGKGTDIYALGMILYEMFAGRLPFQGSFAELITHHLMTVPESPSRFRPMPRALDELIMRCLDKDPAQRPQTAEDLARLLDASLPIPGEDVPTGVPVPAPAQPAPATQAAPTTDPPGDTLAPPPGRTSADLTIRPARNRRGVLVVAGVAAVVVVGGVLFLGTRHSGGNDRQSLVVVVDAQSPATTVAPKPVPGRAHVVVKGVDVARVLVDGKVVAAGVREASIPDLAPGVSHALRVEAADRDPHERAFTVGAGGEVELEVSLAASGTPAPHLPPGRTPGDHARRHDSGAPKISEKTPSPTTPPPATSKPRHRDGLVGDDIFDK